MCYIHVPVCRWLSAPPPCRVKVVPKPEKDGDSTPPSGGASPEGGKPGEGEGPSGGGEDGSGEGEGEDSMEATPPGADAKDRGKESHVGEVRLKRGDVLSREANRVAPYQVPPDAGKEEEEERIPRAPTTGSVGVGERVGKPLVPVSANLISRKRASQSHKAASQMASLGAAPSGSLTNSTTPTSSPRKGRKEDGWKEVGRR